MQYISKKAFTLVELLIVIGIIGILAVTLMVSLNPVEAQRKARDGQRLKDVSTLQSILEQAVNDGVAICGTICRSDSTATPTATQYSCNTNNWLGNVNVCNYARTIPGDPQNGRTSSCSTGTGSRQSNCTMAYYVMVNGADYEINVRQESTTNANKIGNDGGNNNYLLEMFTGSNNLVGTAQNP